MATEGEQPLSEKDARKHRRIARRKTVLRMLVYDTQHDTSSRIIAKRIDDVSPHLGITPRLVTYFRRKYHSLIHSVPRK